jgi:hypothetical protein
MLHHRVKLSIILGRDIFFPPGPSSTSIDEGSWAK